MYRYMEIFSKTPIRVIAAVLAGVSLPAAAWFLYPLGVAFGIWQPFRPSGVSRNAHYVSLLKEGTWFDCSVDLRRNVNVCSAWDEEGKQLASGDFRLDEENRAATAGELKPSSVLRDEAGHAYMILLRGPKGPFDRALVPVRPERPQ